VEAAHLAAGPARGAQARDSNPSPGGSSFEHHGFPSLDSNRGLRKKFHLLCQRPPVDIDDALWFSSSSGYQPDAISEFVSSEPSDPLFTEWKAPAAGANPLLTLPLAMIVARNEPDIPDRLKVHAVAIIPHLDPGSATIEVDEANAHLAGAGVVGVFDQLEDGETRAGNQLITEQLQKTRSWSEGELQHAFRFYRHLASGIFRSQHAAMISEWACAVS